MCPHCGQPLGEGERLDEALADLPIEVVRRTWLDRGLETLWP